MPMRPIAYALVGALLLAGVAIEIVRKAAVAPKAAPARHGLLTGFTDIDAFELLDRDQRLAAFRHMRAARGSIARLSFTWRSVAVSRPPNDTAARDPGWRGYRW